MYEMKKAGRYGVGFIDPNTINEYTWKLYAYYEKNVEESMLEFFKRLKYNEYILLPYSFPVSHTVLYYKFCFCLLASYMFLLTYICPLS